MDVKRLRPKLWTHYFLLVIITTIITVFTINYTIDPFGNRHCIVNKIYKPIVHERSEKYSYIFHQQHYRDYDCLILGSSRVMTLQPNADMKCYNFGVHVANNPEKLFILEEWLKHSSLKRVYLGNELYNFHAKTDPLKLNPAKFTHGNESNYLSFQTFLIALKALNNQIRQEPQTHFLQHGTIRYSSSQSGVISQDELKARSFDTYRHDYIDLPFSYEPNARIPLQKIKQLCAQHHIKLYPFITPTYGNLHASFEHDPHLSNANKRFRNDLRSIFGTVYDFDIPHPHNSNPTYFYDPIHYRPVLAKQLFERFDKENGYGILLKRESDAL